MPPAARLPPALLSGRFLITTATPVSSGTPAPRQAAPDEIAPVQFVEPEPAAIEEHPQPVADHSEAGMLDLRSPFTA
jgi:hypothetical protein